MKKKTIMKLLAAALLTIVIVQGIRLFNYKRNIATLSINDVSISDLKDGSYKGFYDMDYVKVNVEVNVRDGKITDLDVTQKNETKQFHRAREIKNRIITLQTLNIDAVSGATASSKAILKATEEALKKGL